MVYEMVEKELLKETDEIIPVLEEKWENSFDGNSRNGLKILFRICNLKKQKAY